MAPRPPEIRTVNVTRYVTPLREGGSLPAIVEADDDFLYVMKFRGAGQGKKALVAELIGGELARALGLKVPELVFMNLDVSFSTAEPDEEIQDLLKFSTGLNLGLHYLSGAITYDPLVSVADALTASKVVLLDSLITNVDRTWRNTNMLNWNKELWLIDHGASLYFHHTWEKWPEYAQKPFPAIKDHVLMIRATMLEEAKEEIKRLITKETLRGIVDVVPDEWLEEDGYSPQDRKEVYVAFLTTKLSNIDRLTREAADVRKTGF
ncbi:MAG: HipA family kinase [Bacteroidia bacterium]|nr:HipA family kinase [Bacteroidia bacterium]